MVIAQCSARTQSLLEELTSAQSGTASSVAVKPAPVTQSLTSPPAVVPPASVKPALGPAQPAVVKPFVAPPQPAQLQPAVTAAPAPAKPSQTATLTVTPVKPSGSKLDELTALFRKLE